MRYVNDPRQSRLFDVFESILSPLAYRELLAGWQRLFRETILELMPVGTVKQRAKSKAARAASNRFSRAVTKPKAKRSS